MQKSQLAVLSPGLLHNKSVTIDNKLNVEHFNVIHPCPVTSEVAHKLSNKI